MTDEQLKIELEQLKNGDVKAFERIYNELKTPVYTVALRLTGSRADAEDVTQEVFIKLFKSPPDDNVKKPRAFIFKIAHNTAVDLIRKNPRCEALSDYENELSGEISTDCLETAELISKLPPEQRRVVALHINADLKFREIAEITNTPLGTVLWRYNKAISALRGFLNGGVENEK